MAQGLAPRLGNWDIHRCFSYDGCAVFNNTIPNVDCQVYSYDFHTRQCALLGGERPNVCAEPVVSNLRYYFEDFYFVSDCIRHGHV